MSNVRQLTVKELLRHGFKFAREGKKHTVYFNPETKQTIPVKRHAFNENDRRYIYKEAGIEEP